MIFLPSRKWNQNTGKPPRSLHVQDLDSVKDSFECQVSDHGAYVRLHASLHTHANTRAVRTLAHSVYDRYEHYCYTPALWNLFGFVLEDMALSHCLGWPQTSAPRSYSSLCLVSS